MVNEKAAALFDDWDEALIWSCLQGYMGSMIANEESNPVAAIIDVGDFCFCAGKPDKNLLKSIYGSKLLIPKDECWEALIEDYFGKKAKKRLRYAIKKESDAFDEIKLNGYVDSLAEGYELKLFDKEIFQSAKSQNWSADLCSQFKNYADYEKRALGVAILHHGKLVSGASPYAVYHKGIEIEIDTKPEYREKGLATVCGAKLILECLERNLYPSWDAHDLRSVHLAEKLGYHLSHPYVTYELMSE